MSSFRRQTTYLLLVTFALQTLLSAPLQADHIFTRLGRLVKESHYCGTPPCMCEDGAIECLAENIDWLEHHIDCYGSIVAKQPDIWGEARLTKHRDEYERILYQELNQFEFKLNAAIRQSDQSFASAAIALSNAAGTKETRRSSTDEMEVTTTVIETEPPLPERPELADLKGSESLGAQLDLKRFAGGEKIDIEPTVYLDQLSRYVQHLHELRRINEGDDTSDSPGYALNLVRIPVSLLPGKLTREGWGAEITVTAEPVLSDDLLATTFRNLVINDMVDQNALPVTQQLLNDPERSDKEWNTFSNHGNQVQVWITGYDKWLELLQKSGDTRIELQHTIDFYHRIREYMLNRMYQMASKAAEQSTLLDVSKAKPEDPSEVTFSVPKKESDFIVLHTVKPAADFPVVIRWGVTWADFSDWMSRVASPDDSTSSKLPDGTDSKLPNVVDYHKIRVYVALSPDQKIHKIPFFPVEIDLRLKSAEAINEDVSKTRQLLPLEVKNLESESLEIAMQSLYQRAQSFIDISSIEHLINEFKSYPAELDAVAKDLEIVAKSLITKQFERPYDNEASIALSVNPSIEAFTSAVKLSPRSRNVKRPLSPSQYGQVYGFDAFYRIAGHAKETFREQLRRKESLSILSIRDYLSEEIQTAYDWLEEPQNLSLWTTYCTNELANAIHQRDYRTINTLHRFFERDARVSTEHSVTGALAWGIIVDSALLNQRLNADVRKVAKAKGCCNLELDRTLSFFIPDTVNCPYRNFSSELQPSCQQWRAEYQEASHVFQEYVRCRWPIHVFALDPRETDQNVADLSARRRELQLALSLGFVQGEISANALMNYSRQLETEIETISLNRTIAGFGHGHDTFGWRFYPRVQALDQPGAIGTVWQSFRGTPRDADLRHRQIEPGMRECVAIVLMPSFVPYADFDVRTNWFRLTNPKNAALTMKETVKLSKAITAMRQSCAQCSQCAHFYRPGEVDRMMKRVEQLDRELPLQEMRSQVPYENTLGGFEMFNTGVTDLAPELLGWYGTPGIVLSDDANKAFQCGCYADCDYCKDGDTNCIRKPANIANVFQTSNLTTKTLPFPICEGEGTTLFLVGKNLSVHDTKVIAGGVCIPHVRLVSRDIMRVTIPSCVNKVKIGEKGKEKEHVAIYAATPYGVTGSPVYVPVQSRSLDKNTKTAVAEEVKKQIADLKIPPAEITIKPDDSANTKLQVEAICDSSKPKTAPNLDFQLKPGVKIPDLSYVVENGLAFRGRKVTFKAAVFKGQFFDQLFDVKTVDLEDKGSITGNDLKIVFDEIRKHLIQAVSYAALNDDGKETVELIFFVDYGTGNPAEKLPQALEIEVTQVCKCCDSATATASTPSSSTTDGATTPTQADGANGSATNNDLTAPTEEVEAPDPADSSSLNKPCNCSALRVVEGAVR